MPKGVYGTQGYKGPWSVECHFCQNKCKYKFSNNASYEDPSEWVGAHFSLQSMVRCPECKLQIGAPMSPAHHYDYWVQTTGIYTAYDVDYLIDWVRTPVFGGTGKNAGKGKDVGKCKGKDVGKGKVEAEAIMDQWSAAVAATTEVPAPAAATEAATPKVPSPAAATEAAVAATAATTEDMSAIKESLASINEEMKAMRQLVEGELSELNANVAGMKEEAGLTLETLLALFRKLKRSNTISHDFEDMFEKVYLDPEPRGSGPPGLGCETDE